MTPRRRRTYSSSRRGRRTPPAPGRSTPGSSTSPRSPGARGGCTVNAVSFGPGGDRLVAAGDNGTLICRNSTEDIMDVSFSPSDPDRFVAGSIDKTFAVWELRDGEWSCVSSQRDHVNYVQGVAYDPRGVYLASMGSDRTVRVYSRRAPKGGTLREEAEGYRIVRDGEKEQEGKEGEETSAADRHEILQRRVVPDTLASSKFDLQKQVRTIKFLEGAKQPSSTSSSDGNDDEGEGNEGTPAKQDAPPARRHNLFADEITLGSFFRRLSFTSDGAFLVVPAGQWHGSPGDPNAAPSSPTGVDERLSGGSFATYLFARHRYETPYKVLAGLEKPSVCVRPNPVLFELPEGGKGGGERRRPASPTGRSSPSSPPTRSSFTTPTTPRPSRADGRTLFVTSTDGYVSVLSFADGELGTVRGVPDARVVRRDGVGEKRAGEERAGEAAARPTAMAVRKKPKVPQPAAPSSADGEVVRPVNTLVAKRKPAAQPPTASSRTDEVSRSTQPPAVNTLVAKKKPKKPSQPAAPDAPAESSARKVKFSPFAEVKEIEPARRTPAVNDLSSVARKKKKKGGA
ncbi:hypothetical protein THAOC_06505, partial [Thalassiosira oceanica]